MKPSIDQIRAQFPALQSGFAFLENAGGSQVPQQVIDRVTNFFHEAYVQTSAGYPVSDRADEVVAESKAFANLFMNGEGVGKTILGPSTTDLIYRLANAYGEILSEGDEVVISIANHESNIGPWVRLERLGIKIKWWKVDPEIGEHDFDELESLCTDRTKIVAVSHTSNLLGDILDVQRASAIAHSVGAKIVVDGVAYAPHQAVTSRSLAAISMWFHCIRFTAHILLPFMAPMRLGLNSRAPIITLSRRTTCLGSLSWGVNHMSCFRGYLDTSRT